MTRNLFFFRLLLLVQCFNVHGYVSNTIIPTPGLDGTFSTPLSLAITPDGRFVYVTNLGSRTVSVISTASNTIITSITGFNDPQSIAITPDGEFVYVANAGTGSVIVIEVASNTIISTPALTGAFGYTAAIAITPNGKYAYVSSDSDVKVIDIATNTIIPTPYLIGFFGDPGTLGDLSLTSVTDVMNYLAGSFSSPDAIAITPDGRYAYVADLFNQVQVIDIATNTIIPTPKLTGVFSPPFVQYLSINPNGKYAYVSSAQNGWRGTVSVIDIATNALIKAIGLASAFNFAGGSAVTPDGSAVYVVNPVLHSPAGTDGVAVIDTASNTVIAAPGIASGFSNPQKVAITPDGKYAYVTDSSGNSVTVIFIGLNPPLNFMACKRKNIFLTQTEPYNQLTWTAPSTGNPPASYAIYRDAELTELVAIVPAGECLQYNDRKKSPCLDYTYYIVSVDAAGNTSVPAVATTTNCCC